MRTMPLSLNRTERGGSAGYSLLELTISMAVMTVVSGAAFSGIFKLTKTTGTVSNRTEMHAGVRNATALLQQEIGQAGRITFAADTLTTATAVPAPDTTVTLTLVPVPVAAGIGGLFVGEQLVVDVGNDEETVTLTAVSPGTNQVTALFKRAHNAGVPVRVYGGFRDGIVPPTVANGSTGTVLKLFGDINGTGEMVYVEYSCDIQNGLGNLIRRSMPIDTVNKPAITADQSLLNNIVPNPGNTPCFTYQSNVQYNETFVTDVAVTLTVQTPDRDPETGLFQTETKALLNVSPRNVFNMWQLAGQSIFNRVQPTPPSVTNLLPQP